VPTNRAVKTVSETFSINAQEEGVAASDTVMHDAKHVNNIFTHYYGVGLSRVGRTLSNRSNAWLASYSANPVAHAGDRLSLQARVCAGGLELKF
jgi:hypothetical protein